MKNIFLTIVSTLLICGGVSSAQVIQKGRVLVQNSGNTPLSAVTILIKGAMPTSSDDMGNFRIYIPEGHDGDRVVVYDICKKGYELVNETDVRYWNLSSTEPFVIIMCPRGNLDEARRKYYDLGRDLYYDRYCVAADSLRHALEISAITQKEYEMRVAEAEQTLSRAMDRLSVFADRFARVNRDDLSELDKRAFEYLDVGDIESAVSVYDEAELLDQFRQKRLYRDSIIKVRERYRSLVEQEAALLRLVGTAADSARADSLETVVEYYNQEGIGE